MQVQMYRVVLFCIWCMKCVLLGTECNYTQQNYQDLDRALDILTHTRTEVAIVWGELVANISLECLHHLELRDGFTGKKLQVRDDLEFVKNRKPFLVELDICRESYLTWQVVFAFYNRRGKLYYVGSQKAGYELPSYYQRSARPPYCFVGSELWLALLEQMVPQTLYRGCITQVELCECDYCTQCELIKNSGHQEDSMIIKRNLKSESSQSLRLYYYWHDPRVSGRELTRQISLEITQGHCDKFFDQHFLEHNDTQEGSGRGGNEEEVDIENHVEAQQNTTIQGENISDVEKRKVKSSSTILVISAIVAVVIVFVVIVIAMSYAYASRGSKRKKEEKEEQEEIDQNPDYGYDNEGAEYHESAIKDTNIYYGEDSDDDDLENYVQDVNPFYEVFENNDE